MRAEGRDCDSRPGAALFAGCSISRIKIEDATKACLSLNLMMILVLLLVIFVPAISMFIPEMLMGV